jgi:starch phosphorylase
MKVAYFSMEFGLHESQPIYSGGLGILAGDHLKSASDLGLPLAGVGLLYRQGYFRQYLNNEGWQQEYYPENDFYNLPLTLERDEAGKPLEIELEFGSRKFRVHIWRVQIGRVPLYLLDTNLETNSPDDRLITAQLYFGDKEMRMIQEILLGIGGIRALRALGIIPNVCHMNEGHAAFLALERIRLLMDKRGITFSEAREVVSAGNIFTTHTPVEAGIDHFPADLLEKYSTAITNCLVFPGTSSSAWGARMSATSRRTSVWRYWPSSWPGMPTVSASYMARFPAPCGRISGRNCPKSSCRSTPSPTAYIPAPGCPTTWPAC